jgi:E3 ubiquitin-protein ligase RAD18
MRTLKKRVRPVSFPLSKVCLIAIEDDGFGNCPICNRRMKIWQIYGHTDTCTGAPPPEKTISDRSTKSFAASRPSAQSKGLERLPALNYSMLKEPNLRKKLQDLGISTAGNRALLERRHKEWTTLWNANCDSIRPKRRAELLRDLEEWEKTQGGRAPALSRSVNSAPDVKDKEFDGSAWATKHDSTFKDLIASARKSRAVAKQMTEEASSVADNKPSGDGEGAIGATSNSLGSMNVGLNSSTTVVTYNTSSGGGSGMSFEGVYENTDSTKFGNWTQQLIIEEPGESTSRGSTGQDISTEYK